jgi:transporter family-2 protein
MLPQIITILIGLLGGIAVGIQTPVSNAIGRRVGGTSSSFIIHFGGAIFSGILLILQGGENIKDIRSVPWWMLGAGGFGIILYLTINHTIPRIGATTAVTLIVIGQLITGMVIDHFGLLDVAARAIDGTRLLALLLLLAGAYLMAK